MAISKKIQVRIAPFLYYVIVLAISSWLDPKAIDVRWVYGLRVGGAALLLFFFRHQYTELAKTVNIRLSSWLMAIMVGLGVFLLWISLDQSWMLLGKAATFNPYMARGTINYSLLAMRLFGSVLVVPVMEELFFRSYLMRWIDCKSFLQLSPGMVSLRAAFITSMLFASAHMHWFAALLAGMAYAMLYRKTQTIWMPIFAHAITNALLSIWVIAGGHWSWW